MRIVEPPSPELRARFKALAEEPLPLDEWKRRLAIPLSPEEREHNRELSVWFCRRYPTAGERLAWARRSCRRWVGARR
jgi:hypothetical protein